MYVMVKHLLNILVILLFSFTANTLVACSDNDPVEEMTEAPTPPSDEGEDDDGDGRRQNDGGK